MNIASLEDTRLEIQAKCDSAKDQSERNRLGQFATPPKLAIEMVRYGLNLLGRDQPLRFLDPALGTGAFYSALLQSAAAHDIKQALGFELDPAYAQPARELWSHSGLLVRSEDFTRTEPPAIPSRKANFLICNPPYVRHHHLTNEEKRRLHVLTAQRAGLRLSGLAGLYCYFLGLAHAWLEPAAIAGWLIPSEFMNVNYGAPIKDYLLSRVTLLRIHRFDPNDVQFGDALVSSAIVWFRNESPSANHAVELSYGGTLSDPRHSHILSNRDLRNEPKWARLTNRIRSKKEEATVKLSDLFTIKRGLATGANSFFVLTPERTRELNLPKRFLVPILPSPRHLLCDEVLADEDGNPTIPRKQFLLDCRLPEDEVKARYPSLWSYLAEGRAAGVADRYLCGKRSPWYSQERRLPPPFFCTYIGRSETKNGRPFRFILNHSRAVAANVYLLLYPKPEFSQTLKDPQVARNVWTKLNEIDPGIMIDAGRVYGGGLHKLEPGELANVSADEIIKVTSAPYVVRPRQMALFERQSAFTDSKKRKIRLSRASTDGPK